MTTISAKVIESTLGPTGIRLDTIQLRYPRFIHGQMLTHRDFSRNASSSQAVPVKTLIQQVMDDPAEPVLFGQNQPGMKAAGPLRGAKLIAARSGWHVARHGAVMGARLAYWAGAHKQVVNRLIEPWSHIDVIVTSSRWDNFWDLRCDDADPTMEVLAGEMRDAYEEARPREHDRRTNTWTHLPLITPDEREMGRADINFARKLPWLSAARCARVSYGNHRNVKAHEEDLRLAKRLLSNRHLSPFEHIARADRYATSAGWHNASYHGNFDGFIQFRKTVEK